MEVKASEISKKRVSLSEQKKSHTLVMKLLSVVANVISRLGIKWLVTAQNAQH
jgi:hypothetical protein